MSPRDSIAESTPRIDRTLLPHRPTHVRWIVVGLLTVVSALNYLDRLNFSIAGKYIQDEFNVSTQTMGWIFSAFVFGYAPLQTVVGWLGDRYGPRKVMTFAILWWSVFTMTTAIAPRLPLAAWFGVPASFMIVRLLIGMGESATYPNANKIVAYWMGSARRALGISISILGVGVGGSCTPLLISWLMVRWGWRAAFYVCGILGVAVALIWNRYVTDRPERHSGVNAYELALIRQGNNQEQPSKRDEVPVGVGVPWKKMLSNGMVWAFFGAAFCIGYAAYIFYTWFFIYLVRTRGLSINQGGIYGAAPFVAIAILTPIGGWFSDYAVARLGHRRGRQMAVWMGVCCSGTLLYLGGHASRALPAVLLLAGAAGFNLFATVTLWAACNDLAPACSGLLSGLMNTAGTLGGACSPIITAYVATHWGWPQALDFAAILTLVSGLLWVDVKCDRIIE